MPEGPAPQGAETGILLVAPDPVCRERLLEAIRAPGQEVASAATGRAGLDQAAAGTFGCVVVDQELPDMDCREFLRGITAGPDRGGTRIVVFGRRGIPAGEEAALRSIAQSVIVLRDLDDLPSGTLRRETRRIHGGGGIPPGRRVLVVDRDPRRVRALRGILEGQGLEVLAAPDGGSGLSLLAGPQAIDLVLLDVAMPDPVGFAALREIRAHPGHADLPVIAFTDGAVPGDRERCLEAGASDYLSEPYDGEQILSVLQFWLVP